MNKNVITIAITLAAAASIFAAMSYNGAKMAAVNSPEHVSENRSWANDFNFSTTCAWFLKFKLCTGR